MARLVTILLCLLVLVLLLSAPEVDARRKRKPKKKRGKKKGKGGGKGWMKGTGTNWGFKGDKWSINSGHCGYGNLSKKQCTGYNVAALSDHFPGFNKRTANCGKCYEIRCSSRVIKDVYGRKYDRRLACRGVGSVVVQVVDVAPCNYKANKVHNAMWNCPKKSRTIVHMDISFKAFEKLAPTYHGVIGIEVRRVSCKHKPYIKANGKENSGEPKRYNFGRRHKRPCPGGPRPKCTPAPALPKCTDEKPPGPFSCARQRKFGKCREGFMLTGGYFCRKSCQIDHCLPSFVKRWIPGKCMEKQKRRSRARKCVDDLPITMRKYAASCKKLRRDKKCNHPAVRRNGWCRKTCRRCR